MTGCDRYTDSQRTGLWITLASATLIFIFAAGYRLYGNTADRQEQLQGLILRSIKAAEVDCTVSTNKHGRIDWCNAEFERTFNLRPGDLLSRIMPDEGKEEHTRASLAAMKRHDNGSSTEFSHRDCEAITGDGDRVLVEISAWTTPTGMIGFLRVYGHKDEQ